MKFLKCIFCNGELDIIGNFNKYNKKVKCLSCGFTNNNANIVNTDKKSPEIFIIKKSIDSLE